ncbi:uncharacterized protein LOC129800846 isoform X2 [Phlebotomus papatasi]|uniref:uncharacterized protein LOC129800846 isoform X2 n=1 Tax=Phlebotomus papatasi TaxID=29031 RepID=UPI0024834019|nr:uncharacterized protein LOC129800846 isoform X2 [Phlebotomus papatasi]
MDQDKSATQECYEFLDLSDVNDTERSQLATTLYPSEKQQAHVSWVHESLQQQQHRYQHQHALGGVANIGSEVITNRVPPQHQQQPQGDASCHQELEHDPAVINSWPEAPYANKFVFAVNGNNYEKTPSETETESSVATDYTEFVHHQPSHQGQHHQHHQQSNTEMSPHSHHQHQQSQTSGHQQISGQNAAGGGGQHTTLASMYTSGGHGQSTAYLPQGSQMYHHQMLQPSMPGNVYVSNMTANVNVHSFLGAQMPPQPYMQPTAPPFLPNDMTGQTVVATSHDQSAVHQPVNMPNMRMGGGGGPRRGGRGNKGGSHRRGGGGGSGGDYASRQQQDLQQQQQRQEQQRQQQQQQQQNNAGVPQPQEMMPHMMEPHQVMGAPGYATAPPQLYYPYQPPSYYQPHSALPHLSAQHAAGHPLYVQSPALSMYPPGHQMGYQTHPSMLMYHTAMMSPAEYGMMDDKGDDQSVMSDGSVGVIGPMWHPQVQMDFPLDHGVMQPGQEEYLVQPEMMDDPAAGALIMPTMMSPQQQPPPSPAPTTGHHVLNPDVANFITRKQQMEQQAQQQSQMVHQQMLPTDFVQNQTMVKPVTSPQPVTETIPVASVTAQEMPSASPKSPVVVCSSNDEQQQMSQEMHHHHHQQQQVAFYEECREENTDNNIGKIETVVTIESVQQQQQQQQQQSCEQNNLLGNVTVPENVPSVAAINNNNNNNVVKPLKQEDTTRLAKMTNDKLMIKNDRGQKPPVWNKKSTTSVSVTALPSSTPITTSLTHNNADVKQQQQPKVSPPPFANQKSVAKALSNATTQVPKVSEINTKSPNLSEQNYVASTDGSADKKTEVSTLLNKTVQAIPPIAHSVANVDAKQIPTAAVTTFESKQVEVLPQIQQQQQSNVVESSSEKVTTNGVPQVDCVVTSEKGGKLETNSVATSTTPIVAAAVVTTTAPAVVAAPPPSKSWASLFSSDSNSSASGGGQSLSGNKKPVAKVPPFEPTQTLPIGGLSYSAASALGLPTIEQTTASAKVTAKSTKSTVDDRSLKLGEFFSKYQIDNSSVILCPRGLTNRSNFCYINAILQALVACPPFYHMMKKIPLEPPAFRQKTITPIIDAMVELVSEFSTMPPGARLGKREKGSKGKDEIDLMCDMAFEPTVIHKMLSGSRSEFHVEGRQEDAEEFLGFILNGLNDEMLELMKLVDKQSNMSNGEQANGEVQTEEGGDDWQVIYGNRNKGTVTRTTDFGRTPISDIFGGQLRSRVQREGDHSTDVIQPFFTLQLDIEKAESVKEALEILVVKDQLEGVTCSKTNQEVAAWQQVTLEKLPVVLILHLKWFDFKMDSCTKILKTVEFPIELRIDTKILSSKKCVAKQRQYKLFAVVYHDGKEASKGHYITDVFNIGYASWIRYDDSIVRSVSEQTVLHPHLPKVPYLLYYRRCDTIGPQSQSTSTAK